MLRYAQGAAQEVCICRCASACVARTKRAAGEHIKSRKRRKRERLDRTGREIERSKERERERKTIVSEGGEQEERTGGRRGVGTQRSVSTAAAINNVRPKRRDA